MIDFTLKNQPTLVSLAVLASLTCSTSLVAMNDPLKDIGSIKVKKSRSEDSLPETALALPPKASSASKASSNHKPRMTNNSAGTAVPAHLLSSEELRDEEKAISNTPQPQKQKVQRDRTGTSNSKVAKTGPSKTQNTLKGASDSNTTPSQKRKPQESSTGRANPKRQKQTEEGQYKASPLAAASSVGPSKSQKDEIKKRGTLSPKKTISQQAANAKIKNKPEESRLTPEERAKKAETPSQNTHGVKQNQSNKKADINDNNSEGKKSQKRKREEDQSTHQQATSITVINLVDPQDSIVDTPNTSGAHEVPQSTPARKKRKWMIESEEKGDVEASGPTVTPMEMDGADSKNNQVVQVSNPSLSPVNETHPTPMETDDSDQTPVSDAQISALPSPLFPTANVLSPQNLYDISTQYQRPTLQPFVVRQEDDTQIDPTQSFNQSTQSYSMSESQRTIEELLQEQLQKAQCRFQRKKMKYKAMVDAYTKSSENVTKMQQDLDEKDKLNKDLQNSLQEANNRILILEPLEQKVQYLENEKSTLSGKVEEANGMTRSWKDRYNQLQQQYNQSQQQINQEKLAGKQLNQQMMLIQATQFQQTQENQRLQNENQRLQTALERAQYEVGMWQEETFKLKSRLPSQASQR